MARGAFDHTAFLAAANQWVKEGEEPRSIGSFNPFRVQPDARLDLEPYNPAILQRMQDSGQGGHLR